jgi:hypothetical protein
MDTFETRLRDRLVRLEAAAPVRDVRPRPNRGRRGLRTTFAIAAALLLGTFAVGLAVGRFVHPNEPVGHPGLENPGQPFYGAGLRCMTPPDAHRTIVERGFTVTWQIEDRDPTGAGTTSLSTEPPPSGVVEDGFVEGNKAHVVVSVGSGAIPYLGCD